MITMQLIIHICYYISRKCSKYEQVSYLVLSPDSTHLKLKPDDQY